MIQAPIPENEAERLQALKEYNILDTIQEEAFTSLVQLASQICETSISLISLIDSDRQWFKARVGLDVEQTSREIAFCSHAILGNEAFIISDASKDERFFDNPLVLNNPEIRFYVGIPLTTPKGFNIGTLCVIDNKPKTLNELQLFALKTISQQVIAQLELRQNIKSMNEMNMILRDQASELNRLNSISMKLISVLTHDLRSPLASFKAYSEMFVEGELSESEKLKFAGDLSLTLGKTIEMVDNVLKWGSDQMKGNLISYGLVSLKTVADKQIETMQLLFHSKKNNVVNNIQPDLKFMTDENLVQFVFRNLIQNANKFTANGTISLHSRIDGNTVEITVSDTGIGVSPKTLKTLFDWNVNRSTMGTSGEKGTGIGLKLCREFVEKLGGNIRVESTIGKGTDFIFTLPMT